MRKKIGYLLSGVSLIYIATAFIIPFPTEILSVAIAQFIFGGLTVLNLGKATILLYVIGSGTLLVGLYLVYSSKQKINFKNQRKVSK